MSIDLRFTTAKEGRCFANEGEYDYKEYHVDADESFVSGRVDLDGEIFALVVDVEQPCGNMEQLELKIRRLIACWNYCKNKTLQELEQHNNDRI